MAAKIDLDKAYDKLDWSFIKYTLMFYHFPTNIVDLIKYTLMINGCSLTI